MADLAVDHDESGRIPRGFRRDLFDAAVAELKRERLEHGDLHQLACRQLAAWIEQRDTLTDDALWAGLRDRFLPFGHVEIDGKRYDAKSPTPLNEAELRAAEREGRVTAHGNLHWTGLARAVGSERDDVPAIRAAIDWILDETIPFDVRIAALVGGDRHVRGFGIAVWTGFYAMARDWEQPAVNETVNGAYEKLDWPLVQDGPAARVAEVRARGELLLAESGLRSLSDIDWVYWRVLDMESTDTPTTRVDTGPWWLFQGSPARYDIDRAVSELERLTWTTSQHASEIKAGHRVFLYRTGQEAAVIALATVESNPAEIPEPDSELAYWRDASDDSAGTGTKVWLRIDRIVEPPVTRDTLLADRNLRDLANLRVRERHQLPSATRARVTTSLTHHCRTSRERELEGCVRGAWRPAQRRGWRGSLVRVVGARRPLPRTAHQAVLDPHGAIRHGEDEGRTRAPRSVDRRGHPCLRLGPPGLGRRQEPARLPQPPHR